MKIEKATRDELVKNLKKWKRDNNKAINQCISAIEDVALGTKTGVEEVMYLKKELLLALLERFPVKADTCYFCILHDFEEKGIDACKQCEYAKKHQACDSLHSGYQVVAHQKGLLQETISRLYFKKGESYD